MADGAFAGKTALITGGSRGIGRAVALRLASEEARVAVNYMSREDQAVETVRTIEAAGGTAISLAGDVSQPDSAQQIVENARQALGPIDILVHCAGISIVEPATQVTWQTWKKTMDVNLDGTFNTVYAVIEEMIERQFGRIVTLSSIAGLRERENQVHYSASKAAVIAFTRCCAQAWARHNVRVNCVCPGLIETEMAQTLSQETQKNVIDNTPMQRIGQPEEIAALIRFLVSEESSFMTGQSVVASGGRVMLPG